MIEADPVFLDTGLGDNQVIQEDRKMAKEQEDDQVRGGVSQGGRREAGGPTGVPPGQGSGGPLAQGQRWTAARKREVVLRIFRGNPWSCFPRELGVELYRLDKWRDAALAGMEEALKARNGDPLKAELDNALKRLGELSMENELLWARVRRPGPLAQRRSRK
jgi:transposase